MGITLPRGAFLAVLLVLAGLVFLFAYRVTFATHAVPLPHGASASGIPYWPGAYEISRNYTYYVTEHPTAIGRWNIETAPRDYLHDWASGHDTDDMRQYMVYTGSGSDIFLGQLFMVSSCKDRVDSLPGLGDNPAFEWGWGDSNNDSYMTVVCLNVAVLGYTEAPFDELSAEERIKGVTHEMGHSLHLDHDFTGVMHESCVCLDITQNEVNMINFIYILNPP